MNEMKRAGFRPRLCFCFPNFRYVTAATPFAFSYPPG